MAHISLKDAEKARMQITKEQEEAISKMYHKIYLDFKKQMESLPLQGRGTATQSLKRFYLNRLTKQLKGAYESLGKDLENQITQGMQNTSQAMVSNMGDWLKKIGLNIEEAYSYVPKDIVAMLSTGQVYGGGWTLSKAIWGESQKHTSDINKVVANGVAANKSAYDIAKDLEQYVNPSAKKEWSWSKVYPGTSKKVDYNAQRLARTMVSHAYQQSLLATTKHNPFVSGYRWRSAHTHRTCELCNERDGKVFSAEDLPLDHPNGLCTFIAELTDSMEDIADRLGDWAQGKEDSALDAWYNSMGGNSLNKAVPSEKKAQAATPRSYDILPQRWKDILGVPQAPFSLEDCLANINPRFNDSSYQYKLYHENCQRCSVAYEMRRRGYNVVAKPFDGSFPDIMSVLTWNSMDFDNYVMSSNRAYFGGDEDNPNKIGRNANKAAKNIVEAMNRWGNGSRAVLNVSWRGSSSSHVVNVENFNGVVKIIDSQSGGVITGEEAIAHYMGGTTVSQSLLVRTDNLEIKTSDERFADSLDKAVVRRK